MRFYNGFRLILIFFSRIKIFDYIIILLFERVDTFECSGAVVFVEVVRNFNQAIGSALLS